ncbi:LysR family transcriptional regulator [Pseudorhizobium flavum]|uniref:LysR family transcriptional regulator n=1 Tax=Pseudorhizobium flavum TaxID=1335061 RepID=UPI0037705DBD
MDIELARTFLEIVSTSSFVRASERLNVAQTTVSARIRTLESQLGRPLFVRHKNGATLTPAGEQFLRYAPKFVQLWQHTQHQVAVPPGRRAVLTIGSDIALWQPLLLDWVTWIRSSMDDVALRVHVDVAQDLFDQVAAGMVDVAIMYAPHHRPGLTVDLLTEEKLVLVTTDPGGSFNEGAGYVHINWGPDFALNQGTNFLDVRPDLFFDFGPLALNYILKEGGSGYFRMSAVEPHLRAGRLSLVVGQPQFSYPVYAVQSASSDPSVVNAALAGLREIAKGVAA